MNTLNHNAYEYESYGGYVSSNKRITLYGLKDKIPIPSIWPVDVICSWFKDYEPGLYWIPGEKISNYKDQAIFIQVE